MSKSTPKKTAKKLAVKKKTVSMLTDRSIVASLKDTNRPVIIISGGCATDFTRQIPAVVQQLMTDITRPVK